MLNTHHIHHATLRLHSDAQRERVRLALPLALQQALDAAAPPDTLWLLRRLPCRMALADDASLDDAVRTLQRALQAALQQAGAAADDGALLRLRHPCDALNGAFADALTGRRDRGWAWARLGLWTNADPPRADAARLLADLLPALDRRPLLPFGSAEDPAPAHRRRALLSSLLTRGLLPRTLALLTPAQWAPLATGLPGAEALLALPEREGAATDTPTAQSHPSHSSAPPWPDGADAAACLAVLRSAPLPAARRAAAAQWLAWLAWLHSDAIGLAAASADQVQGRLGAMAQTALRGAPRPSSRPVRGAAAPLVGRQQLREAPAPAVPAEPVWRTAHGGLLHLLPLLPTALSGAGSGPRDDAGLSRERLLRLAVHGLGLPPADPVLAVWLGAASPASWQAPAPDAQTAADRAALAASVQALLQRHLPAPQRADIEADPLPWLLQRSASLHSEPGRWLAVFDEADTRLRRCGLDRDPGHLPWLGLTVVLRYE